MNLMAKSIRMLSRKFSTLFVKYFSVEVSESSRFEGEFFLSTVNENSLVSMTELQRQSWPRSTLVDARPK